MNRIQYFVNVAWDKGFLSTFETKVFSQLKMAITYTVEAHTEWPNCHTRVIRRFHESFAIADGKEIYRDRIVA